MNAVISTAHLSRKFLSTEAVQDLNLEVPEASIFGFLGPNGAGKTTTIKTLMNIFVPSSGSATVLGLDSRRLESGATATDRLCLRKPGDARMDVG